MDQHLIAYYIGIFIMIATHIYLLTITKESIMVQHSYINLIAALLIAYYFLNKEGFIEF